MEFLVPPYNRFAPGIGRNGLDSQDIWPYSLWVKNKTQTSVPGLSSPFHLSVPAPTCCLSSVLHSSSADSIPQGSCKLPNRLSVKTPKYQQETGWKAQGEILNTAPIPSLHTHTQGCISCSSPLDSHTLVLAPSAWICSGYPDTLPYAPEP